MNKALRLSLINLLLLLCGGTMFADDVAVATVTFPDYNDTGVSSYTAEWTATVDGKVWTFNGFNNNNNAATWTFIKCGRKNQTSTATIHMPTLNEAVTKVAFTVDKTDFVQECRVIVQKSGEETRHIWIKNDTNDDWKAGTVTVEVNATAGSSIMFQIENKAAGANGPTQISKIVLYKEGTSTNPDPDPDPTMTQAANIAAFKALATGTEAELTLTDAQVLYVNGTSDMYVRDASGAIDFYQTDLTYTAGQKLNGSVIGKYSLYKNLPEFTKTGNTNATNITAGEATEVTPKSITADEAADNLCDLVKFTGVTLTETDGKYYVGDVQVYDKFNVVKGTPDTETTYNIEGIVIMYNNTVEICPTKDYTATTEPDEPTATIDWGFEKSTATTENVGANGNGQSEGIPGWTLVKNGWNNSAVFTYGSEQTLNGKAAPATAPDGDRNNKNALGLTVAWGKDGSSITYQSEDVTLPAGTYYLKAQTYNSDESATYALSRLGFITNTTSFVSSKNSYPCNTWSVDYVKFTLDEETTGKVQVGIASTKDAGSGSHAKVFFDNIEIVSEADLLAALPVEPGTYYLQNVATGKFLARGDSWGTKAMVSNYGIGIQLEAQLPDVSYKLTGFDNDKSYGMENGGLWSDKSGDVFTAELIGENVVFTNTTNDKKLMANAGTDIVNCDDDQTAENAQWVLLTKDEYDAFIATRQAAEKAAAFSAAGIDLDATLEEGEPTVLTFATGHAWTENVNRTEDNQPKTNANGTEMWQATGSYAQQLTSLPAGLYKVSIQAFYRSGGLTNNVANEIAKVATGYNTVLAYLEANGVTKQVKSWSSDRVSDNNPNSMAEAKAAFDDGKYTSEFYTYVDDGGTLDLLVDNPSYVGNGWFIVNNVTVTPVEKVGDYTITVRTFSNGELSDDAGTAKANKKTANEGDRVTISYILADEAVYYYDAIMVYYYDTNAQNMAFCNVDENLSFLMPAGNVYVDVLFGELPNIKAKKQWTTLYFEGNSRAKADGPEKASYYSNFYEVPEGLKVYTVVNVDREENVVEVEEMDYVMADVPMLIERTDDTKTVFPLTAADPSETPEYDYNNFYGTSYDWTIPNVANSYYYVYVLNDGVFRLADGGVLPANRCYIELYKGGMSPKAPEVLTIKKREGESTGIETIDNSQLTIDKCYTIQGYKVTKSQSNLQKGVYIMNGKKVIIK